MTTQMLQSGEAVHHLCRTEVPDEYVKNFITIKIPSCSHSHSSCSQS